MQRFLQLRLGCPAGLSWLADCYWPCRQGYQGLCGLQHAVGNEKQMILECTAPAPLRQQHADLFTPRTDTMPSFLTRGPSGGFELRCRLSDSIAMIGTSDHSC